MQSNFQYLQEKQGYSSKSPAKDFTANKTNH